MGVEDATAAFREGGGVAEGKYGVGWQTKEEEVEEQRADIDLWLIAGGGAGGRTLR